MTHEHPLLAEIRHAVAATGAHRHHWGELRRAAFPVTSWEGLEAWCAENQIACEIAFSQASMTAEVQFLRLAKAPAKVQEPGPALESPA